MATKVKEKQKKVFDKMYSLTNADLTPYEGVGVALPTALDTNALLEEAGLDWEVEKLRAYADGPNGEKIDTGKYALVRDSDQKVLDLVSGTWNPVQNKEAFDFFNSFIEEGGMQMEAAGSVAGGKKVWALAKVNESFDLFDGDVIDSYLLFTNPHEFGAAIDIRFTPKRVTCSNMIAKLLRTGSERMVKVNHSKQFDAEAAKATLLEAQSELSEYKETAEFLGSKQITDAAVKQYFNEVFPATYQRKNAVTANDDSDRTNVKLALEALEIQPGTEFAPGSWWQALNAVTYLTDHVLGKSDESRLRSQWYGINQRRKIKAVELAIKYANAA
jgi:phage/plasmid-like protein (TIGR03299 family)